MAPSAHHPNLTRSWYPHLLLAFYASSDEVCTALVSTPIMPHCALRQALLRHTKHKADAESQSQMPMQGWTVFHLVSLLRGHGYFGWNKFRGSLFEGLLYCHTKLSYSDAEVGGCVAHDFSHHGVFYLELCRVACTLCCTRQ